MDMDARGEPESERVNETAVALSAPGTHAMGRYDSDKPIEIDRPAPLAVVISSSRGEKRVVQKGCVWHHACRQIGLDWKEPREE